MHLCQHQIDLQMSIKQPKLTDGTESERPEDDGLLVSHSLLPIPRSQVSFRPH
jgi:hypothetical protein